MQLLKRFFQPRREPLNLTERGGEPEHFFLKEGYQSRTTPEYLDMPHAHNVVYQPDVYSIVGAIPGVERIIDIGCGKAQKLQYFHPDFQVVGLDMGANIEYCKKSFTFGTWLDFDLESTSPLPLDAASLTDAIIICADVIEHLVDPTGLLTNIQRALEWAPLAVISTPERDLVRGSDHNGPPPNPHHIREWNSREFTHLIRHFDMKLVFLGLTAADNVHRSLDTIFAVVTRRQVTIF